MVAYYVRTTTGSNSNNGLSAGAAWQTIGKALTTITASGSGDTVYVGSGIYREQITAPTVVGTSGSNLNIIADIDGTNTTDPPGDVELSAYTSGDTSASPTTNPALNQNKAYYLWTGFTFVGSSAAIGSCVTLPSTSNNCQFIRCHFISPLITANVVSITQASAAATIGHTFDSCVFNGGGVQILLTMTDPNSTSNPDCGVTIKNCYFDGGTGTTGVKGVGPGSIGNTGKPGGVTIFNCLFKGGVAGVQTTSANWSTVTPMLVYNSIVWNNTTGMNAAAAGQIVEDYCYIGPSGTVRTNVTAGTHSQSGSGWYPRFELFQWLFGGRKERPFFGPAATSMLSGFGNVASISPTVDMQNRPRPSGAGIAVSSIGPFERHDVLGKELTTTDAGGVAFSQLGTYDHDLFVPVTSNVTSIAIKVQWDGSYGAGTLPQVLLVANAECNVTTQTVTATGSASAWNTITLANFTPSVTGVVKVRLISYAAAAGKVSWDTATINPVVSTLGCGFFRRGEPAVFLTGDSGVVPDPLAAIVPASYPVNTVGYRIGTYLTGVGGGDTPGTTTLLSRITGSLAPTTGDAYARLGAPTGASIAADIQTRSTYAGGDTSGTTTLLTRVPGTVQPQTGDSFARLGAPSGASIAADVQTRSTYAGGDTSGTTTLLTRITGAVAPTTGDAYARLGAPVGASISADIQTRSTYAGGAVASVTAAVIVGGYSVNQDPATLVLDTAASGHNIDGSVGSKIFASGTIPDPWASSVPAGYAPGQAGYVLALINSNLSAGVVLTSAGLDGVVIEAGINARQALAEIGAAAAGTMAGKGTPTQTFAAMGGTATRIVASTDSTGRTAVNLTPPA
jgi:hypothetical protein